MTSARPRTPRLAVAIQFALAIVAVVIGGGYDWSPATPTRHPLTAPLDPTLTTAISMLALAAAGCLGAAAAWLLLHLERLALWVSAALVPIFGAANLAAVWVYRRADPPLPGSWDWLFVMHLVGAVGTVAWGSAAVSAWPRMGRSGRE